MRDWKRHGESMNPIMRLRGPQEDWKGHGETKSGGLGWGVLL